MNKHHIYIGRILNIPIGLDFSWFLIFALIIWSLASSYFPMEFKGWPIAEYWIVGAVTALLFFVSVLLHELGHSVVALHYKIPVRSITLFLFGGIAQIASEPPSAVAEFWIAIAGPLVSFALAGLFALAQAAAGDLAPILALAKYLAYINGVLGLFNLIPGFPLDGGRVFRALVWGVTRDFQRATRIAATVGRGIAFLFIFWGVWQIFSGDLFNGLWIAFIGWFLESAANAQLSQQHLHALLEGHTVAQAMSHNYALIPGDLSLQQLADEHILGAGRRFFVVEELGQPIGLLTISNLNQVPRSEWPVTTAARAMTPVEKFHLLRSDSGLAEALEEMDLEGINQLPVTTSGQVQGILSRESVMNFLRTLQDLNRSRA
ncbi:MAG TPA: site-2 protease family protein [Anaerolineales bacterium]|nr:site-2 protease family protein [Anaerolineales bacterium]